MCIYHQRRLAIKKQWIQDNGPCRHCGSWERLELDHIDRSTKVTHQIHRLSKVKREAELLKCQVLCHPCHFKKTRAEETQLGLRRFSDEQVLEIDQLIKMKKKTREIAEIYGVSKWCIKSLRDGRSYSWLTGRKKSARPDGKN